MREPSQFPRFTAEEMAQRHARVYELMDQATVQALLVYGAGRFSSEIYWLTDWPGGREAYVLFQPDKEPVVLVQLYNHVPMARVLSVVHDVRWAGPNTSDTVLALIHERNLEEKRIGLVGGLPYQHYEKIRLRSPRAELKDLNSKFRLLRAIKSDAEIDRIRFASKLTDESLQALADGLKAGMREEEIPALLEPVYLKAGGYAGIHFMTSMPMSAPHFPVPAQYQSDRILQRSDCLITEISGAYWGYSGQIHRTFSLGEGPTQKWQDLHAVAVEAFEAIAGIIKEGTSTREIEETAEIIHRRGYTIYDDLVHGANQYPPIIQTRSTSRREGGEMILRENMVVVIQPNVISHDEKMGLQFGETVLVKRDGCESLNAFPRQWVVVPA